LNKIQFQSNKVCYKVSLCECVKASSGKELFLCDPPAHSSLVDVCMKCACVWFVAGWIQPSSLTVFSCSYT